MITIWKAVLKICDFQDIELPQKASFLTAREQHGELCIWYICDPSSPKLLRRIAICGTGHTVPDYLRYIGTGFLYNGNLVLHVFEVPRDGDGE